jgi:phosphoserine aminotransferase
MKENGKAAYLDTGTWSVMIKEAKPFEKLLLCFFKEENYNHIQKDIQYRMMQIIFTVLVIIHHFGTQIKEFPSLDMPIVCDMSSDIFSRVLDFSKFDIICWSSKHGSCWNYLLS